MANRAAGVAHGRLRMSSRVSRRRSKSARNAYSTTSSQERGTRGGWRLAAASLYLMSAVRMAADRDLRAFPMCLRRLYPGFGGSSSVNYYTRFIAHLFGTYLL